MDDPAFQAQIGLEALKGELSMDKICREFLVDKKFVRECREVIEQKAATLFE